MSCYFNSRGGFDLSGMRIQIAGPPETVKQDRCPKRLRLMNADPLFDIKAVPKAELHVHVEGTLEPAM
ncbi:hypothetical protein AB4144_33535, partial [Rhizobiaceae sp. 2RAB30]